MSAGAPTGGLHLRKAVDPVSHLPAWEAEGGKLIWRERSRWRTYGADGGPHGSLSLGFIDLSAAVAYATDPHWRPTASGCRCRQCVPDSPEELR